MTKPAKRTCVKCKKALPCTTDNFWRDGKRNGRQRWSGVCRPCGGAVAKPTPRTSEQILTTTRLETELRTMRAERDELVRTIFDLKRRQTVLDAFHAHVPKPIKRREFASGLREAVAYIIASDWHVEEPVIPEKVNGLNEYSLAIADERIQRLMHEIKWNLELARTKYEVRDVVLALLGDFMSGHIHEELKKQNEIGPLDTVLWLFDRFRAMIEWFLKDKKLERLVIPCTGGNHGRITPKREISNGAETNLEWALYQLLAAFFRGEKRVEVVAPKADMVYVEIYDFLVRNVHGFQLKFAGGIGGLTIPLNKAVIGWNTGRDADVTCMGHWHQRVSTPNAEVNGSLIGYGPYSIECKFPYERPVQTMFLMDSKRGKVGVTNLWVSADPE